MWRRGGSLVGGCGGVAFDAAQSLDTALNHVTYPA
jgi:hypothetical protein